MLIDPWGRVITYLRISITDRCNLRCAYCLPESGVKWMPQDMLLTTDEIVQVVEAAAELGITKVRLTGGEPLVRTDVLDIINRISKIEGITDFSLTTNAVLLGKMAGSLKDAGLQRVNISLDTLQPEKFKKITRVGNFSQVWEGILTAEAAGLQPIKLNCVIVGGLNDDEIVDLASLSIEHSWHVRFIELMPVANEMDWGNGLPPLKQRYFSVQSMHERLHHLMLQKTDSPTKHGPEQTFRIPGALGTVGFIAPLGNNFCNKCNRLRLTADGNLRFCLLVDKEISIRQALRDGNDIKKCIENAVKDKPKGHELSQHNCPDSRYMSQIGG